MEIMEIMVFKLVRLDPVMLPAGWHWERGEASRSAKPWDELIDKWSSVARFGNSWEVTVVDRRGTVPGDTGWVLAPNLKSSSGNEVGFHVA